MHRIISRWPIRSSSEFVYGSGSILLKRGKNNGFAAAGSFLLLQGKNNGLAAAGSFRTVADWKVNFGCGGESTSKPIGQQVVNALQLGHRNQASSLLSEFDAASHMINAEDVVNILEYCAKKPDPLFVMETWRVLQQKKITLTRHNYLLIVRALLNGGHVEEAISLVKFLAENHQVSFILPVYNFLLSACAKMKDVMYHDQCLNLMDTHLLGKNEHTYTALLELAVSEKNLLAVHEILREQCKYYNLNIVSLRKFIWSFTELNDLESANKTLQYMVSVAFKEGTYLRRTMLGKIVCPNLDIPIPSATITSILDSDSSQYGDFRTNISDGFEEMITNTNKDLQCIPLNLDASMLENPEKGPIKKVLRWSFNEVIRACSNGNAELAGKLIMQMQTLGLEPSPWTYDSFVRAVIIPRRRIHDTVEFLKIIEEKEVKLNDSTLLTLSMSFSRALNLDSAESLLNQISRSSHPGPYNAFLAACDKMEQPERAIPMLAKMRDLKIKPNIWTYALLFSLFGNVNAPYEKGNLFSQAVVTQRIDAIQADMLENGVQHNEKSMFHLLNALGSEGMVQEMMRQLFWAEKHLSTVNCLNVGVYNIVLHWLGEANETCKAVKIFKNMKRYGLQPDAATYNIMVNCCEKIRCLESARALVSLMVRDGFPPETPTYTAFIQILMRYNAFDEALNLLDQALSEAEPEALLFNAILSKASFKGRIHVVEHVLKVMHRERIRPDPSTCSYVFEAYIKSGHVDTAVEALQVLSIQMISKKNNISERRRNRYENLILSEEPDADMKITQKFNHSSVELVAGLLNLRWCSIVGASILWDPDQSPWAKRIRDTDDGW